MHVDQAEDCVGLPGLEDYDWATGLVVGGVKPVAVFEGRGGVWGVFGVVLEMIYGCVEEVLGVEIFGWWVWPLGGFIP